MRDAEGGLLRCEQPPELRGLVFLELDPHAFCSAPLVLKIAVQDVLPHSAMVSWQSRNHSGLHGYQVAYHALDNTDEVTKKKALLFYTLSLSLVIPQSFALYSLSLVIYRATYKTADSNRCCCCYLQLFILVMNCLWGKFGQ